MGWLQAVLSSKEGFCTRLGQVRGVGEGPVVAVAVGVAVTVGLGPVVGVAVGVAVGGSGMVTLPAGGGVGAPHSKLLFELLLAAAAESK